MQRVRIIFLDPDLNEVGLKNITFLKLMDLIKIKKHVRRQVAKRPRAKYACGYIIGGGRTPFIV